MPPVTLRDGHTYEEAILACPEPGCGGRLRLRVALFPDGAYRFPKHPVFYSCERFPRCRGRHSAHADGRPLGTPGDEGTIAARRRAHEAFDAIWQGQWPAGPISRGDAYRWLTATISVPAAPRQIHIGASDAATCARIEAAAREAVALLRAGQRLPTLPRQSSQE